MSILVKVKKSSKEAENEESNPSLLEILNRLQGLKGRNFIDLNDYTGERIFDLIMLAKILKEKLKKKEIYQPLKQKVLGMIFEKHSTRTRVSFEVGMLQLGGNSLFLSKNELQIGRGEPFKDTARVLSSYLDAIMIRTDSQEKLNEMAKYATIPIINGLSDLCHPTQALADYLTLYELKGEVQGLKIAYVGDGNNVLNSLLVMGAKLGTDINIATPVGFEPRKEIVDYAREEAKKSGAKIELTSDPKEAVKGADAVYTDVWISMGQEEEKELRMAQFQGYQVNDQLMKLASKDAVFMHCLPAHRGEEVTEEVIEGEQSVVFQEAENRLHAHKAILLALLR